MTSDVVHAILKASVWRDWLSLFGGLCHHQKMRTAENNLRMFVPSFDKQKLEYNKKLQIHASHEGDLRAIEEGRVCWSVYVLE